MDNFINRIYLTRPKESYEIYVCLNNLKDRLNKFEGNNFILDKTFIDKPKNKKVNEYILRNVKEDYFEEIRYCWWKKNLNITADVRTMNIIVRVFEKEGIIEKLKKESKVEFRGRNAK